MGTQKKTIPRVCEWCQTDFLASVSNVRMGWGRFCSKTCTRAFVRKLRMDKGTKLTIRMLRVGEAVPDGTPARYISSAGYVRLRWLVGRQSYIESYEHRIVGGRVADLEIHHKNGNKLDNRPENLMLLSKSDHAALHARLRRSSVSPPMIQMEQE